MYWRDHAPPHFHANYAEHWAQIAIADGQLLSGSLPARAQQLVREWRTAHVQELRENWQRVQEPQAPNKIEALP